MAIISNLTIAMIVAIPSAKLIGTPISIKTPIITAIITSGLLLRTTNATITAVTARRIRGIGVLANEGFVNTVFPS